MNAIATARISRPVVESEAEEPMIAPMMPRMTESIRMARKRHQKPAYPLVVDRVSSGKYGMAVRVPSPSARDRPHTVQNCCPSAAWAPQLVQYGRTTPSTQRLLQN